MTATTIERDLLATLEPMTTRGRLWVGSLLAVCTLALVAWTAQLRYGLRVTDMRNYVSWGMYMTNFVFFIGISHAGTLISAILRVTDAGWRRPITRMAEAITVIALLIGASMVLIDMGRPDRLLNLVLHGRLQSPILWDVVSVTTYLSGSFLYLYVAMIPDMPVLAKFARERGRSPRLVRFYEILSLGYRESPAHRRLLARALGAMAVIIIPVAVSVHTVVSWVFGMTLRPGWHSTIFGPYFVIGAIFSGTAAIITAMGLFRRAYHLERYLLLEHFHKLGKILLALSLLYAYFTLSEYLTTWYGGVGTDSRLLELLAGAGPVGAAFWLWAVFGLFVPIGLLLFPSHRSLGEIMTASVLINIGMWVKRYLIIVPTLQTTFIPAQAAGINPHYFPSLVEIAITLGAIAAFLLFFTLFSRLFPILSIWETVEDTGERERIAAPVLVVPSGLRRILTAPGATVALLLAGGVWILAPWTVAGAQHAAHAASAAPAAPAASAAPAARAARAAPAAPAAPAGLAAVQLELTRVTEDGQEMLLARVMQNGQPVEGATVAFAVARTFGTMALGEDQTLSDGTVAVEYPSGLPGDSRGNLTVSAAIRSPPSLAGAPVRVTIAGLAHAPVLSVEVPRALWSSRAPLAVVGTIGFLLLCVWTTYGFVVVQLAALFHLPEEN